MFLEKVSSDSRNLMALALINNILSKNKKKTTTTKSKTPRLSEWSHGWKTVTTRVYMIHPKTVPPKIWNLEQKINDSKPHIWILSFNFRFSSTKSQNQQKLAKKITHFTNFTIRFCSKNLTHFTNLNALNIAKIILPQHSQQP